MNKNIFFAYIISTIGLLLADPPNWEDDPGAYEFTATISGGIVLSDGSAMAEEGEKQRAFESEKAQAEIEKDITVAEIRAAGYGAQSDINENKERDFRDAMKDIRGRDQYREQMNFKREQAVVKNNATNQKLDIDREKLSTQRDIANKNLQIARENKNKYDVKKEDKKKKK